jgi:hypothetical protein
MGYTVILIVAVAISAVVQICTDPRITKDFIWKSFLALAVFAVHLTIGILVMISVVSGPASTAVTISMVAAWFGWLGLGGLGLVRFAPRTREPPRWLMHFGLPDIVCLAVIIAG